MLKDELLHLGLTEAEVAVYLATLEIGGGYVSNIASKAKVNRVTSYNTLGNLVKKGYVTYTMRRNVRFYVPEPPQVLVNQLEEKYQTAQKIVPELLALQGAASFAPKIRYYEERDNILCIFEDMAKANTEILGYTNLEPLSLLFPDMLSKLAQMIYQRKKKARFLAPFDVANEKCITKYFSQPINHGLLEIFTVNAEQFPFKNGVFFYDDKMAIISYDKKELLGVIIQSTVNTQTQKAMFDLAWLGATSFIVA